MLLSKERYRALGIGSTFLEVNKRDTERFEVLVPPTLGQQIRLAGILSTVDEAIDQTEALIAKTLQIKAGLLHDLFTRGVIANGKLRPPREEAPQLYKESPVGWIPTSWKTLRLGAIADSLIDGPFGSNLKSEHYIEGEGVRVIRLQNIQDGHYNDSDKAFVSEKYAAGLIRHQVMPGDILIAALGEDSNPVGRACCYPAGFPAAINKADCFRLRCKRNLAANAFVMEFLNTARAKEQLRRYEQGVTRRRINLSNLKRIIVALPGTEEQESINDATRITSGHMAGYLDELQKLKMVKQGLMQDLLSGPVRACATASPEIARVAANV
jgi:type I restriction enzyme S subunit